MLESSEDAFEGFRSFKANFYPIFGRPWSSQNDIDNEYTSQQRPLILETSCNNSVDLFHFYQSLAQACSSDVGRLTETISYDAYMDQKIISLQTFPNMVKQLKTHQHQVADETKTWYAASVLDCLQSETLICLKNITFFFINSSMMKISFFLNKYHLLAIKQSNQN